MSDDNRKGGNQNWAGYDIEADMTAKGMGNTLKQRVMELSVKEGWDKEAFANAVLLDALGFLPFGDGTGRLSDDEVRSAIPEIKAMLKLAVALTRHMSGR